MSTLVSRIASGRLSVDEPLDIEAPLSRFEDHSLLYAIIGLGLFGAVMIASASMAFATETYGSPFYFVSRQLFFLAIGAFVGVAVFRLPLSVWEKYGPHLILLSLFFLLVVGAG